jgi:hypothetical protein
LRRLSQNWESRTNIYGTKQHVVSWIKLSPRNHALLDLVLFGTVSDITGPNTARQVGNIGCTLKRNRQYTEACCSQLNLEPFFYKGHDLSSLKMLEEGGCIYKDTARNNQTRPAEDILGDGGMNSVRLRVWVNPVGGTYGLGYNLELAKRFQDEGYKIYLDFHFS